MAEPGTIARPYAKAAFAIAQATDRLAEWSDLFAATAPVLAVPEFRALLGNPAVPEASVAGLLAEFAGDGAGGQGERFLQLLVERRRVALLPAIRERFEALRAQAENRVVVEVTSAVELDDDQRARIAAALKARLGLDVELETGTDESILGGAVVRAGDLVIDGSVRGRLDKLAAALAR